MTQLAEDIDMEDIDMEEEDSNQEEQVSITKAEYEQMKKKIENLNLKKKKAIETSSKRAVDMEMLEKTLEKRDFIAEHPSVNMDVIEAVAEKKWLSYREAYLLVSWSSQSFVWNESAVSWDNVSDIMKKIAERKWIVRK